MNRENIKSILLICLVFLSMFFTYKIWFEIPFSDNTSAKIYGEEELLPKIQLMGALNPGRIIIHYNNNHHSVLYGSHEFYTQIWLYAQNLLKDITQTKKPDISTGTLSQWIKVQKDRSIEIKFHYSIPISSWCKLLNDESNSRWEGEDVKFDRLLIDPRGKKVLFKDEADKVYILDIQKDAVGKINNFIVSSQNLDLTPYTRFKPKTSVDIDIGPGVYVPKDDIQIPKVEMKGDSVKPNEFASLFFPNMSVVRKIKEIDGALIYTDGQKGLRLYADGTVEYNNALVQEEPVKQDVISAFKLSGNFLKQHNGWVKEITLLDVSQETTPDISSYKFLYTIKFDGLLVKAKQEPIQVTVSQNEVNNYFHIMKWPTKDPQGMYDNVCPAGEAFNKVTNYLEMLIGLKKGTVLKDLYIAYFYSENQTELIPVWVFEFDEMEVLVNAVECQVIGTSS